MSFRLPFLHSRSGGSSHHSDSSRSGWHSATLVLLTSLWIAGPANWPLWQTLFGLPGQQGLRGGLFALAFGGIIAGGMMIVMALAAWPRLVKWVIGLVLLSAASGAHFMGTYGVVIDSTMMINVLQTDPREVRDLLSLRMLLTVLLLAGLPLWWIARRPLRRPGWKMVLGHQAGLIAGGLLLAALCLYSSFATFSATMRNHTSLRYKINPLNSFYALGQIAHEAHQEPDGPPQPVGLDAKLVRPVGAKPPLMVLVLGETARADHFSLNGYARPTNPELSKLPVLSLRDVTSCGTNTAASLPCMFSLLGREGFLAADRSQENVLDLLQRAGLAVLWLDNQSGCKGQCDRIHSAYAHTPAPGAAPLPAGVCQGEECFDAALLHGLDERINALPAEQRARGVVLVMHQMGSHGPAYHDRSPPDRKPFQPECTTPVLQDCNRQALVNAYDNSIAYADHIVAGTIGWLRRQDGFDRTLIYISDHGESLGENNLYLHGLPYRVAPREQKHVPLILWWPGLEQQPADPLGTCLKGRLDQPFSHDHLSHTLIGWLGVQAAEYRRELDLTAACRQ